MKTNNRFHPGVLDIDPEVVINTIINTLRQQTFQILRKRGLIVSVSGGIDSSVTAALSALAVGPGNVITISLPERDSDPAALRLGSLLASHLGVKHYVEDITSVLDGFGCYRHQREAVREIVPEFGDNWKFKIVLAKNILERKGPNLFNLIVENHENKKEVFRLPYKQLLEIIAATNYKQRTRKQFEYYYADRYNYAVAGTPNRLEYDQGFFVKGGDGLADVKPIAHLFKTQVFAVARYLNIPKEILEQKPTTDTYSLQQSQEEFFFSVPLKTLDLILWAHNHHIPAAEVAPVLGYTEDQVTWVYDDLIQKRKTTAYLHRSPLLVEKVEEICPQ